MISDIAMASITTPQLPFIAVVYTPPDVIQIGQPYLRVFDPRGIVYDYTLGFGVLALHSQPGYEGQFLIDHPGTWDWEWEGFYSNMDLKGTLEVLHSLPEDVVR